MNEQVKFALHFICYFQEIRQKPLMMLYFQMGGFDDVVQSAGGGP